MGGILSVLQHAITALHFWVGYDILQLITRQNFIKIVHVCTVEQIF